MDVDFNIPTIITKRNVDSNGSPISVKLIEIRQIMDNYSCVVLSQKPDEFNRIYIEGFTEVFDIEKLDKKNFKVDYNQGIVYFHPFNIGKAISIEYYGVGYELISASRVFTKVDSHGNIIDTLESILERADLQLKLIESLGGAIKVIEKLDENIKNANNLNAYFDEKIPEATEIKNELDTIVTDAKGWKDQLHNDVQEGKVLQPLLHNDVIQGREVKQQLDQSIADAEDTITKIEATGNEIVNITSSQWTYNNTSKMYEKQITHTCNSENIHVTCKTSDTKEALFLPWRIVDKSNILLKSDEAINASVIISARYYKALIDNTTTQEVIDARKGELTLKDKIDKIDWQLDSIEFNINEFPRLIPETNDYNRIIRAISTIPQGATLKFNNDKYDLGFKDTEITKRITLKGVFAIYENGSLLGTFFENGGIKFKSNNIAVDKIGVNCPTMDNAFQGNDCMLDNIQIQNCVGIAKDHSYLFESYNGTVSNIKIENCYSYNSNHGFILKCEKSIIDNCKAYNHSGYGFGLVSDNIPSNNKVANCQFNNLVNLYAENCSFGIASYSRDYFSEDNSNGIRCSNNNISNININNCTTGILLGDGSVSEGGKTYNKILEFNVTNCNIRRGQKSVFSYDIGRIEHSTIKGGIIEVEASVHEEYVFNLDTDINDINSKCFSLNNIKTLPRGSAPMLNSSSSIYKTDNIEKTVITHIGFGKENKLLYILINENNTIIQNTDYIKVNNIYQGKGSYVILKYENEKWYEIVGYCVPTGTYQYYLENTDLYIDTRNGDSYDIVLNKGTSNKICIDQNIPHSSNILNIIVRSASGEFSFGGFGEMFVLPSDIVYTVNWNNSLSFQFVKFNATGKWVCVSHFNNIPIV